MEDTSQTTPLTSESADLVDDALALISRLGQVGAMKWLASKLQERTAELAADATRYQWLRAGHMEFGVQPDSDPTSTRGQWFWAHSGDMPPSRVDERIDSAKAQFPTSQKETNIPL